MAALLAVDTDFQDEDALVPMLDSISPSALFDTLDLFPMDDQPLPPLLEGAALASALELSPPCPSSPDTEQATSPEPEPILKPAPVAAPAAPAARSTRPRRKRKPRPVSPDPSGGEAEPPAPIPAAAARASTRSRNTNADVAPPGVSIIDLDPATVAMEQAPNDKAEQRRIRNRLSAAQHRERQRLLVHDLKETVKARDAEIAALKRRVAELEASSSSAASYEAADEPKRKRGRGATVLFAFLLSVFMFVGLPVSLPDASPVAAAAAAGAPVDPSAVIAASLRSSPSPTARKLASVPAPVAAPEDIPWRFDDEVVLFPSPNARAAAAASKKPALRATSKALSVVTAAAPPAARGSAPNDSYILCSEAYGAMYETEPLVRLLVPSAAVAWDNATTQSGGDEWLEIAFEMREVRRVSGVSSS